MRLVLRHPAPALLVLSSCLACVAVFTFARPQYHRPYESKMIDFSEQHYYSPQSVRQAFAAERIELRQSKAFAITVLSRTRSLRADDLQVLVGPRTGTGSWGPKLEHYDERFGNVAVMYGGGNEQLLERVKSAVSALRSE